MRGFIGAALRSDLCLHTSVNVYVHVVSICIFHIYHILMCCSMMLSIEVIPFLVCSVIPMRLSTLLSSLPVEVCKERAVSRVLQKLSGFAEQQTIRVRPQLFLKVLGGLEPWELCLPELCVAVQVCKKNPHTTSHKVTGS